MTANPIFVTSAAPRSGTMLLQRLISSSQNGICYGENTGERLRQICEFAHQEMVAIQEHEPRHEAEWANVFEGNYDFWMVSLDLPGEFGKHALVGAVTFYRQHFDEATRQIDKEVWATTVPSLNFSQIVKIADLISDLKCIYMYRNVYDVIRSQKAENWIVNEERLVKACNRWVQNTDVIAALMKKDFQNLPSMLHVVRYEDLIENRDATIAGIEAFGGLRGIKPEVADTPVDIREPASDPGTTPERADRETAELTPEETGIIRAICGNRMQDLYPGHDPERR
ncbi:sulfotransferase [Roseibium aggregatum]|uniref:Sulfotransferase n=1 Tax=Roseibium aggregatum TaxID=187304 RepID=A0A939EG85_9HYPH|nr:sulfotransferase [Roseibium aggregatum]MBN9672423.1 sulfotransferase [Roseibium aggregatum]